MSVQLVKPKKYSYYIIHRESYNPKLVKVIEDPKSDYWVLCVDVDNLDYPYYTTFSEHLNSKIIKVNSRIASLLFE